MTFDSYVSLGRSGLKVSPFCLGTMNFGEDHGFGCSVEESEKIVQTYLDRGGNFLDTANFYTNGHSEQILGDFFAQRPGSRDRIVLATKFFCNLHLGDPNGGGASRKAIVAQLEDSLRRLRTDYVDLYWLHNYDWSTPIEETLRTLDDLSPLGKSATSVSPTHRRGSPRKHTPPRCCVAGRRSPPCRWSIRCWNVRSKASWCRSRRTVEWESCRGAHSRADTCPGNTRVPTKPPTTPSGRLPSVGRMRPNTR